MEIPEMINHIFSKPALYLTKPTVEHLETYIMGYAAGIRIKNMEVEEPLYYGFHAWIVRRFHFGDTYSWSSIISFVGKSESYAFNLAKDLWEEYLEDCRESSSQ
jgi:hypothetical protein